MAVKIQSLRDLDASRKRSLPSSSDQSVPPNKRIPKPTAKEQVEKNQRERELLRQRCALESKAPFYLHPRFPNLPYFQPTITTNSPAAANKPYTNRSAIGSPSAYPYLPTPSTPSSTNSLSSSSFSVSNLVGDTTSQSKTPQSPMMGYTYAKRPQIISPWSPLQSSLISGLPTPPSNDSFTSKELTSEPNAHTTQISDSDNNGGSKNRKNEQETTAASYSNRVPSMPAPFFYMYNHSPLSPVVFLGSPSCGPSSVKSVPSVGSSSGCSSMSEGSVLSVDKNNSNFPRIAPTEYHVGVKPSSSQLIDEDGISSDGIATPTPDSDDEMGDVDVERVESCSNIRESSMPSTNASYPPVSSSCPLSVQSLISNKFQRLPTPPDQQDHIESNISSPASSRGSSPEPDCEELSNYKPLIAKSSPIVDPSNGADTFCLVPGRLSLLSATQKYKISVDEVKRRLSNPECLNASVLGGILRRAKSKNGGHHLRQRLEEKGLSLPPGRRKATEITLFTSLVEGEALHLANDHRRICQNFFPHKELAQIIGRQHANTPQVKERLHMVEGARVLLSEFQAMVDAAGKPSNLKPNDPMNPYPGLTNFNLISHGFGNPSVSTAIAVVQNYLQELTKIYEGGNQPRPQGPYCDPAHNLMGGSSSNASVYCSNQHPGQLFAHPQLLKQEPK